MNIIGDVAGQYDALMRLVNKMPDEEFILVGDIVDRGPKSKQVVEWAMKNATVTMANHEHMMVDSYFNRGGNFYEPLLWESYNGGLRTVLSYMPEDLITFETVRLIINGDINWRLYVPEEHIKWMASNPIYIKKDGVLISHANKHPRLTIEECCEFGDGFYLGRHYKQSSADSDKSFLWNRTVPNEVEGLVQIFGHMAHEGYPKFFTDQHPYGIREHRENSWAIGIDCSRSSVVTGINWPSLEVYQEPYELETNIEPSAQV